MKFNLSTEYYNLYRNLLHEQKTSKDYLRFNLSTTISVTFIMNKIYNTIICLT